MSGPDVADDFIATYQSTTGETLDPFWVMVSHLEHGHDHWTHDRLATEELDLANAVRLISD